MSSILDPSDPGVSKQDLSEWLYGHDPTTTLHTKLTRAQLTKKVREAQPHFFPDPNSDAPALRVAGSIEQPARPGNSVLVKTEPQESSMSVPVPLATGHRPSQAISLPANTGRARISKRVASGESASKLEKRRKNETMTHHGDLESAKVLPTSSLGSTKSIPAGPFIAVEAIGKREKKVKTAKAPSGTQEYDIDLMDFPKSDIFESGNPIKGRDITPIAFNTSLTSSSKLPKLSGAEYFRIQRSKEEKVLTLEAKIFVLEGRVSAVEEIKKTITKLETHVQSLEVEFKEVKKELQSVCEDVIEHDKVLSCILSGKEDDESGESSTSEEFSQIYPES